VQISHRQAASGVGKIRGTAGEIPASSRCAPRVAHRLLSKKIILALSVCLCASDRHGAIHRPSQVFSLFSDIYFTKWATNLPVSASFFSLLLVL